MNRYRGRLSKRFNKDLHALIINNIDHESAGTFRRTDLIGISGCDQALTPSFEMTEAKKVQEDNFWRIMESRKRGQMRLSDFIEI